MKLAVVIALASAAHALRPTMDRRAMLGAVSSGVVVAWLPATVKDPFRDREGQPADLFRLRFKDGDLSGEVEDLEAHEVEQCLSVDAPNPHDVGEGPFDRPWCKV